ncbi:MAG: hypothetical protein J6S12_02085 [Alphaproteobacteria bacterium]|nr:hypothetical protein [Alphaproteobacteria bacterium]
MKGLRLFFAACLAPLVFQAVAADSTQTASRTANRRAPLATTTNTVRTRTGAPSRGTSPAPSRASSAQTVRQRSTGPNTNNRAPHTRTAATPQKAVSTRASTTISPRLIKTTSHNTATRNTTRTPNHGRSATKQPTTAAPTRDEIMARDPKKCREVFYGCMDEFCANKDSQLKRCACSARINEFKGLEQNLTMVEDKLLDFSQRLLTVSMDKEDAAVLNQATAGELAFAQDDTSQSKKMLDEIAKKLNTSFNDSNFDQSLNAISLSLNTDAAYDTIETTAGESTTTKSGTALYSAALPVCREMALEVCSPDELSIAEGGYQMLIEQDCNTVKKSYQAQSDTARAKVFESGALLDMSRLDVHQKRNSDDILTCKAKMLDMLTDSTVCGTDMGKCLDTSGQYIDPTTGDAILSPNLSNLANLIKRPQNDTQTWATVNTRYVSFLNGKKKFLEPAMENCQDIADYVWSQFIEDALSQIKISQDKKLEQVRQSCTTLTAQCLDKSLDSIAEFDARALSIFGISADKTANAMCADIKMACTALFQSTRADSGDDSATNDWESGVTEITTTKSYETILSTCREVGRNCIIQACTSITGNFGLCEDIDKSINRKSIINRSACWGEVYECVASAGTNTIAQIMTQQGRTATYSDGDRYKELYNIADNAYIYRTPQNPQEQEPQQSTIHIYDICRADGKCMTNNPTPECQICRIAEQIWGNCEQAPGNTLSTDESNRIYTMTQNSANETLLSWFAYNTGTATEADSCRDTSCGIGYIPLDGNCVRADHFTSDGYYCPTDTPGFKQFVINVGGNTNCCNTSTKGGENYAPYAPSAKTLLETILDNNNTTNSCCIYGTASSSSAFGFDTNSDNKNDYIFMDKTEYIQQLCNPIKDNPSETAQPVLEIKYGGQDFTLLCLNGIDTGATNTNAETHPAFPSGYILSCTGLYLLVTNSGIVLDAHSVFTNDTDYTPAVISYYYPGNYGDGYCEYKCTNGICTWTAQQTTPKKEINCEQSPTGWTVGPRPGTSTAVANDTTI